MFKFVVVLSVVFGVSLAQRYVHQPGLVAILRQTQDVRPDGYDWAYETENGIAAEERGQLKGSGDNTAMEAQGQFAYTSPEGQRIGLSYVANENGFQPAGDLPTPPPIPAAILRSIEWNAAHPEEERIDYNNRPLINRVIYG